MAEIRQFPGFQPTWESVARKIAPGEQPAVNAEKYCIYNQSRGRFVATSVEAVDASSGGQEARLRNLEPGAGAGLWLLPCPEISPTSIRFLVDLVYLNREGSVLAAVESFPLASAAVSSAMAGSVLVLAEGTVAAGEVHIGDRLVVAAPDEMKRYLQTLKEAKAAAQQAVSSPLDQHSFALSASEAAPVALEQDRSHAQPPVAQEHAQEQAQVSAAVSAASIPNLPATADGTPQQAATVLASPFITPSHSAPVQNADRTSATTKEYAPAGPANTEAGSGEIKQAFAGAEHFAERTPRSAFEALPAAVQQGAPVYQPPAALFEPQSSLFEPRRAASSQAAQAGNPEVPAVKTSAKQDPVPAPQNKSDEWKKKKPAKGWFARLLNPEPEDARITSRESLPGLIAYYFTGGTPQPHAVRDISQTGMYIVTEERWYPGTVVRVTLTDRHNPSTERSITVNAKAVRAGSDGVGFEFVLDEREHGRVRPEEWMDKANGMYLDQVQEFLRVYKST